MQRVSPSDNDSSDSDVVLVRLSTREIILLANALNECREAVEEWEFDSRLGVRPDEAETLRRELRSLLDVKST